MGMCPKGMGRNDAAFQTLPPLSSSRSLIPFGETPQRKEDGEKPRGGWRAWDAEGGVERWDVKEERRGRGGVILVAVGVWSPELSDPWRIFGWTRATHQAPQPPGAAALTGVRVRGLWRDGEGWGGGRNLTAAGGWAAGGGTVQLLEGFLVAVEVRLGGRAGRRVGPIHTTGTNLRDPTPRGGKLPPPPSYPKSSVHPQ